MWGKIRSNRAVLLFGIVCGVYLFLRYLTPVFSPVLIAMLFVTIFGTTLQKMQKRLFLPRQVGAFILLLALCLLITLILWILFSWIVGSLPDWIGRLDSWESELNSVVHNVCQWLGRTIGIDSGYLEDIILTNIADGIDYFRRSSVPGVLSQSLAYAKGIVSFGTFFITFAISTILLAKDYDSIMNKLLDREDCHVLLEVICSLIRYIATYVKAQFIIMGTVSIISAVTLWIIGITHGALWGLLAGVLDALPFFGTSVVLLPIAVTQFIAGAYGRGVLCLLLFAACTILREFMEPRLIGSKMGIPAIAVLVSIYAGIRLFGLWGIIKGPLGFMVIYQTYQSLMLKRRQKEEQQAEVERSENI
jgi:sporulation integral membrane protein YtvI